MNQTIVMLWNCPECGYEAIPALGTVCQSGSRCPNCAYHKTDHSSDYVVESIGQILEKYRDPKLLSLIGSGKIGTDLVVLDPALLAKLEDQGVDWKCKYCEAVHPDEKIAEDLLYCSNCEQWQVTNADSTSPQRCERGNVATDLTGSNLADGEFRDQTVVPASLVADKRKLGQTTSSFELDPSGVYRTADRQSEDTPTTPMPKASMPEVPWHSILKRGGIAGAIAAVVAGAWWVIAPINVEVTITDMPWQVTRYIQELRPIQGGDWQSNVPVEAYKSNFPVEAYNRQTETRQRGTRQVPDGFETYYETERYQSGTTTESYTSSESYQSGTREECTTTNNGNGTASRSCRSVPVYSTRPVTKTRTVPVYSNRQVARQRQKYRDEPVYDTWVNYTIDSWVSTQTLSNSGTDDEPRIPPTAELDNRPYPERLTSPTESCQIHGTYPWGKEIKSGKWAVPCTNFSLVDIGDTHKMRVNRLGMGELTFDEHDD